MVLSAVFWPAFREEKLKVAEDVQRYINSGCVPITEFNLNIPDF